MFSEGMFRRRGIDDAVVDADTEADDVAVTSDAIMPDDEPEEAIEDAEAALSAPTPL